MKMLDVYQTLNTVCKNINVPHTVHTKFDKFMNLRLFGVFGAFENEKRLIPSLKRFSAGLSSNLKVSDGMQTRDFINVLAVVHVIVEIIAKDRFLNTKVNLGTGLGIPLIKLFKLASQKNPFGDIHIGAIPRKETDQDTLIANTEKFEKLFPEQLEFARLHNVIKFIS